MHDSISPRVRNFLGEHVASVETLEALLLLFAHPARHWTSAELAREARTNEWSAELQLQSLQSSGLLLSVGAGAYQANPSFAIVVAEVERTFRRSRVAVISLIYSMP